MDFCTSAVAYKKICDHSVMEWWIDRTFLHCTWTKHMIHRLLYLLSHGSSPDPRSRAPMPFIHSFNRSLIQSFALSFVHLHRFIYQFIHPLIHPSMHSFMHPSIHLDMHQFIHLCWTLLQGKHGLTILGRKNMWLPKWDQHGRCQPHTFFVCINCRCMRGRGKQSMEKPLHAWCA